MEKVEHGRITCTLCSKTSGKLELNKPNDIDSLRTLYQVAAVRTFDAILHEANENQLTQCMPITIHAHKRHWQYVQSNGAVHQHVCQILPTDDRHNINPHMKAACIYSFTRDYLKTYNASRVTSYSWDEVINAKTFETCGSPSPIPTVNRWMKPVIN